MEWYEAAFDRMYPIIYRHRDYAEAERVVQAFAPLLRGREPVLDLACGGGRYLEALVRQRFEVMGLDLSHYLLKACVDTWGHSDRIVQGDMRHLPFASGTAGTIINMFTSFGYFSRDTDNLQVFQEAYRVLRPGGLFLFDFINASRIAAGLLEESERDEGYYHIRERRRIEMHGKYLVKEISILNNRIDEHTSITERLRLYSRDDIVGMFESFGFSIREIFGDYQLNPFVDGVSDRIVVLADKPE